MEGEESMKGEGSMKGGGVNGGGSRCSEVMIVERVHDVMMKGVEGT